MNFTFHINLAHIAYLIGTAILAWASKKLLNAGWEWVCALLERIQRLIELLEGMEQYQIKTDAAYRVLSAMHPLPMSKAMEYVLKHKHKRQAEAADAAAAGNGN